jgi:hypothetical protein
VTILILSRNKYSALNVMMLEDISEEEPPGEVERAERKQLDKLHLLCSLFGEPKHSCVLPKKTSEHAGDDTYSKEETTMVRTGKQQKHLHCLEEFDLFQTVNGNSGEACRGVDEEEKGNELEEIHQNEIMLDELYTRSTT